MPRELRSSSNSPPPKSKTPSPKSNTPSPKNTSPPRGRSNSPPRHRSKSPSRRGSGANSTTVPLPSVKRAILANLGYDWKIVATGTKNVKVLKLRPHKSTPVAEGKTEPARMIMGDEALTFLGPMLPELVKQIAAQARTYWEQHQKHKEDRKRSHNAEAGKPGSTKTKRTNMVSGSAGPDRKAWKYAIIQVLGIKMMKGPSALAKQRGQSETVEKLLDSIGKSAAMLQEPMWKNKAIRPKNKHNVDKVNSYLAVPSVGPLIRAMKEGLGQTFIAHKKVTLNSTGKKKTLAVVAEFLAQIVDGSLDVMVVESKDTTMKYKTSKFLFPPTSAYGDKKYIPTFTLPILIGALTSTANMPLNALFRSLRPELAKTPCVAPDPRKVKAVVKEMHKKEANAGRRSAQDVIRRKIKADFREVGATLYNYFFKRSDGTDKKSMPPYARLMQVHNQLKKNIDGSFVKLDEKKVHDLLQEFGADVNRSPGRKNRSPGRKNMSSNEEEAATGNVMPQLKRKKPKHRK